MAGLDLVHVAYRGPAAAFTDLFGGQVQAFIITVSTAIGPIRAGHLRALAVTGPARSGILPVVPAVSAGIRGVGVERNRRAKGHSRSDHR